MVTQIETNYGKFPTLKHFEKFFEKKIQEAFIEGFKEGYYYIPEIVNKEQV